ncbi:hypothetical protein VNI00_011369 [Paramarasmius palmivorus]|uniref:Uncharacterized protein n=1 Tax=Paramarasmius palmivorus TaxID=297713 RepID=A0AAW0CC44_9AGAR
MTLTAPQPCPLTLERISIHSVQASQVILSLVTSPCRITTLHIGAAIFLIPPQRQPLHTEPHSYISQLLRTVSFTLEELRCHSGYFRTREVDRCLAHLDLNGLNKLRQLELYFTRIDDDAPFPSSLLDFFDKISQYDKPPRLEVLSIPYLPEHVHFMDMQKFDEILQRPCFSSLRQLKCEFFCSYTQKDVRKQHDSGKRQFPKPDEDSPAEVDLQKRIQDFRTVHLCKCEERGILVMDIYYDYNPQPK